MAARVGEQIYKMVSHTRVCEDNGQIVEYGIELWGSAFPGTDRLCCRGISSCRETVEELLERLIWNHVPPAHFWEIIEDYLVELYAK